MALHLSTQPAAPTVDLRPLDPANPGAGRSILLTAPANGQLPTPAGLQLYELFVLHGSLTLDGQPFGGGDHATLPPTPRDAALKAGPDGARLFTVWIEPAAFPDSVLALDHRPATLTRPWGYLDLKDNTDRLPLRWERTRGEATWLLKWPAGHTGVPTQAQNVALEVLVLSGTVSTGTTNLVEDAYLHLQPGQLMPGWHTATGCQLLVRTVSTEA